ncbi:hypothetical protein [Paenarthrobacter sp. PH39-S1]|uniref:hypothetical protein n=1 Tax=Micrococcaceae TaxID=1268 RepID=UPI0024B9F3CB|nr:hypothetical protein [Paenarthrobacter sp. PH39-S1]MDJ0356777.1 hypothetical protein [Paenarthrobacter sp. PH39-S1]
MPWWSWIVIWIALGALSLAYFLLLGIKVWRGFSSTVSAFHEAGTTLSQHRRTAEETSDGGQVPAARPSPGWAVFASPEQMKDDYTAAKAARQCERRRRRVARRAARGQLQSLRDIESA